MILSDKAVQKSTPVLVLAALLLVIGIYCYRELPREDDPDITIPYVFVSTSYRGVAAADIETTITIEIEKKLKGLEGLKKITSVSSEGLSSINVEFLTGTDIDQAVQDVKDKVDEAKGSLPSDLEEEPSVFEVNLSEMPIVVFSLSGTCGLPQLKKLADDLEDKIEGVKGVLEVDVTGGLEREIRLEVNTQKLSYYGLSIGSLQHIVRSENTNTSGGNIRLGQGRFQLRVPGEFTSPEEIYNLIITTHNGEPVYLKEVATVIDGFKEKSSFSRLNGRSAVNIAVKKRSGENILQIAKTIDDIIEKSRQNWPDGTEITKVMDKAKDIRAMVSDLENNILTGLVLVLVVIFFSMGIRNALLVSMAIPFSMLLSFIVLYLLGITLNMVVLFSLTLALGMLVDNAIVIIENCYRFMEQGIPRKDAVMRGTAEVAWPIIGSTLTTIAAFSPMLFWPGVMGEFMGYLPLTLIVTLSSSLFVALIINPAIASLFMWVKNSRSKDKPAQAIQEQPVKIKGTVLQNYHRLLHQALKMPYTIILSGFFVLILMFEGWLLVVGLEKPVEFLPDVDPNAMYVNVDMPEGADINYIDTILRRIEYSLGGLDFLEAEQQEIDPITALSPKSYRRADGKSATTPSDLDNIRKVYVKGILTDGGASSFADNSPNHVGIRFADLELRNSSSKETLNTIRHRVARIPGGEITVAAQKEGPPTGAPINIEIAGDNFTILSELAGKIKQIVASIPHVEDVQDNLIEGIPSVRVKIDRQKAALFGLTTDMIGFALKSAYNGLEVSSFREKDEDYDITVQLSENDRHVTDILRELLLPTPKGEMVPLSTMAKISFIGSLGDISRINDQRVITVRANVDETKIPGPVARAAAEKLLQDFPLPHGYSLKFTGEFEFQQESQDFLSKAFMVALLLIFLILVTMFNSVSQPFIIMTSVILSFGGVFLGLMLFRSPFGIIMTGVGVISLAGVVVNNAIVLIDYTNKLRDRGFALKDAVVAAGATRLRPVVLTAITTILGLIPMITGISFDFQHGRISWVSESSQWWQSMAIVVVFGLLVATFLTLFVVPTLYFLLARLDSLRHSTREKIGRWYWDLYRFLVKKKKK